MRRLGWILLIVATQLAHAGSVVDEYGNVLDAQATLTAADCRGLSADALRVCLSQVPQTTIAEVGIDPNPERNLSDGPVIASEKVQEPQPAEDIAAPKRPTPVYGQVFFADSASGGTPVGTAAQTLQANLAFASPALSFAMPTELTQGAARPVALQPNIGDLSWNDLGIQSPQRKATIFHLARRGYRHFKRPRVALH